MFGLSFLTPKVLGAIAVVLLFLALAGALGVSRIQVANRDAAIAEWQSNCTAQETQLRLFQADQQAKSATIEGLQVELVAQGKAIDEWQKRNREQQALASRLRSAPAAPKQAANEVLDDESSALMVEHLNSMFSSVGLRQ